MNYTKIYNDFINSRKELNKTRTIKYGNYHHIQPVCDGGLTNDDNVIRLTYKEHLFAHIVLLKKYKQLGDSRRALAMSYALCRLMYLPRSSNSLEKLLKHGLKYHEAKYSVYQQNLSTFMKGKNNPNYGHKWSAEQRAAARAKKLKWNKEHNGWNPMDEKKYRDKIGDSNRGLKNGNGRKYKLVYNGNETIITPPVKVNTKKLVGIDYQQFYKRIDDKTRYAPKYDAYLIEIPK